MPSTHAQINERLINQPDAELDDLDNELDDNEKSSFLDPQIEYPAAPPRKADEPIQPTRLQNAKSRFLNSAPVSFVRQHHVFFLAAVIFAIPTAFLALFGISGLNFEAWLAMSGILVGISVYIGLGSLVTNSFLNIGQTRVFVTESVPDTFRDRASKRNILIRLGYTVGAAASASAQGVLTFKAGSVVDGKAQTGFMGPVFAGLGGVNNFMTRFNGFVSLIGRIRDSFDPNMRILKTTSHLLSRIKPEYVRNVEARLVELMHDLPNIEADKPLTGAQFYTMTVQLTSWLEQHRDYIATISTKRQISDALLLATDLLAGMSFAAAGYVVFGDKGAQAFSQPDWNRVYRQLTAILPGFTNLIFMANNGLLGRERVTNALHDLYTSRSNAKIALFIFLVSMLGGSAFGLISSARSVVESDTNIWNLVKTDAVSNLLIAVMGPAGLASNLGLLGPLFPSIPVIEPRNIKTVDINDPATESLTRRDTPLLNAMQRFTFWTTMKRPVDALKISQSVHYIEQPPTAQFNSAEETRSDFEIARQAARR